MIVELRRHTAEQKKYGKSGNFLGTFQVEYDQYQIYVKMPDAKIPFRYGYVGTHDGAPINALVTLPPATVAQIHKRVLEHLQKFGSETEMPRKVFNPTGFRKPVDDE